MSGRIADPVSLFTRYVPPVVEEEPEEEEVAQAPVAPVAPVYYQRPQPVDQGGGDYMSPQSQPTGSGNFFTDLKGLVSPITDLFTTTSPMDAYAAQVAGADFGPMEAGLGANYAPVSQGAPISPVTLEESTQYKFGEPVYDPSQDLGPFAAVGETPVEAAVAAPMTGEVNPATVGVTDPITGVTTYGDGFMTAPAPDPYEASMLAGAKGLFGYPDDRTYAGGMFNALGEDTTREGYEQDDKMRGIASKVGAFVGPNIMGPIFGGMIAGSRIGAVEGPYGRDGAGNYRFNAGGPMGTVQSPYGSYSSALGDYTGLYGLGTNLNTGRSRTPMMINSDGTLAGGAYGYGLGLKADGSFGSLDEFDVLDYAGMYENAQDFSYGGGGDVDAAAGGGFDADMGAGDVGSFY